MVSDKGALDLVLKMLPESPNERIALPDALTHYWLTQDTNNSNKAAIRKKVTSRNTLNIPG